MTTRTAAEPSEEQVRAAAEVIAGSPTIDAPKLPWPAWCGLARSILRAALAPPQEGEVEACLDWLDAESAKDGDGDAWRYAQAARLLRATQNNGHSPVGDESHRRSAEGAKGCHEAPDAPCESPAQSALAQEPVAWRYKERINCGQGQYIDSDWKLASFRPMLGGSSDGGCSSGVTHLEPLYVLAQAPSPLQPQ